MSFKQLLKCTRLGTKINKQKQGSDEIKRQGILEIIVIIPLKMAFRPSSRTIHNHYFPLCFVCL